MAKPRTDSQGSTTIDVSDYGPGRLRVVVGDADGTGKPCVQIELSHEYLSEVAAIALSPKEAYDLQLALAIAQRKVKEVGKKSRALIPVGL